MNLRKAKKNFKRISIEGKNYKRYGTPLLNTWRKLLSLWHKDNAVFNLHCIPIGRTTNRWTNDYSAKRR